MKTVPLHLDSCDRLGALRRLDPAREWESLDDRRYCRGCRKFITGRQITIWPVRRADGSMRLECPTENCSSTPEEWVYPSEVVGPVDGWGRRVFRVVGKQREKFAARPAQPSIRPPLSPPLVDPTPAA